MKMRSFMGAIAATLLIATSALAAEAEGHVKSVDKEKMTITLDDGKSYKLPGEFDIDTIHEGMEILLAYDEVGGENLITDMQLSE